MAEHFREAVIGGDKAPYVTYNSKETCLQYWQILQPYLEYTSEELYNQVFFGGDIYPQWLGYSLGYLLIEKYQEQYNESWDTISFRSTQEITDRIIENQLV